MPGPLRPGGWLRSAGLGGIGAEGDAHGLGGAGLVASAARRERDRGGQHGRDEQRDERERDRPHGEPHGRRERVVGAASEA